MKKVMDPAGMIEVFAELMNAGDLEGLLALYEDDAVLAPAPGQRVIGKAQIRAALAEFLSLNGRITARNNYCMQAGDIALTQGAWTLTYAGPDGQQLEQSARSSEVMRQQADGSWLYAIDHAFTDD
jgi:uncharacterized protein (TIGR02246 family)